MIRVLFFGPVAERVGSRDMQMQFEPGITLQDIATRIQSEHARALDIVSFMAVNNQQTRDMQLSLADNDEIAFMAKFSGG